MPRPLGTLFGYRRWGLDDCEFCNGNRGGVPGNERRLDGKIICDHCHDDEMERDRIIQYGHHHYDRGII